MKQKRKAYIYRERERERERERKRDSAYNTIQHVCGKCKCRAQCLTRTSAMLYTIQIQSQFWIVHSIAPAFCTCTKIVFCRPPANPRPHTKFVEKMKWMLLQPPAPSRTMYLEIGYTNYPLTSPGVLETTVHGRFTLAFEFRLQCRIWNFGTHLGW